MLTSTVSSVFCEGCGGLIPEGVNTCAACGAARPRQPFFYALSLSKLVFFGATTAGLYLFWWLYSQWRAEAPKDGRLWAVVKAFFSVIFFYSLAREVKEEAEKHNIECGYAPAALTALVWMLALAVRLLDDDRAIVASLFLAVPFIPVQQTINRLNAAMSGDHARSWRWWQVVIAVLLGFIWFGALMEMFFPSAPPGTGLAQ